MRASCPSPARASGTSASRVARKPAPCRSGTSRCAKSARHVATWPGSLATPLPHPRTGQRPARRRDAVAGHGPPARRPGDLLSRAFARASGRACRPGQGPQPPDRREILLRLQRFGEGHKLPKGQEGHPRGHEATERRHPTVDGGHQPVQQEAQAQSAPADAPQEESKDGDAAQHSWPRPFPGRGASVGASGGPSAGEYTPYVRLVQGHATASVAPRYPWARWRYPWGTRRRSRGRTAVVGAARAAAPADADGGAGSLEPPQKLGGPFFVHDHGHEVLVIPDRPKATVRRAIHAEHRCLLLRRGRRTRVLRTVV